MAHPEPFFDLWPTMEAFNAKRKITFNMREEKIVENKNRESPRASRATERAKLLVRAVFSRVMERVEPGEGGKGRKKEYRAYSVFSNFLHVKPPSYTRSLVLVVVVGSWPYLRLLLDLPPLEDLAPEEEALELEDPAEAAPIHSPKPLSSV